MDRASRDALGDLTATAETLAEMATCPSCGRFDPVARRIAHGVGLVAPVGLVLAGIAADWFVHSAPLTTALGVVAGAWIYWSTRWRWTESDLRVSFGKPGSGPAGSRA